MHLCMLRKFVPVLVIVLLFSPIHIVQALTFGQWIWTRNDKVVFENTKQHIPNVTPTIWIATLFYENEKMRTQLALSPGLVKGPVAVVVRLDDSMHSAFHNLSVSDSNNQLTKTFTELMLHLKGFNITEFQLDYDCPITLLPRWSETLTALQYGPLQNQNLWITSLVAHIRTASFGELFRGKIAGHILQLFDTGTTEEATEVLELLKKQGVDFRIGLGSFERQLPQGAVTAHTDWFASIPLFAENSLCKGFWVFSAGHSWAGLVKNYW